MRTLSLLIFSAVMFGLVVFCLYGILTLLGDMADQSNMIKLETSKEQARIADSLAAVATKEFNEEILMP